jgi:hypothetical protein
LLKCLVRSPEFLETLSSSLSLDRPAVVASALIQLILIIFPRCASLSNVFIDGGLCFAIPDLLGFSEPTVVGLTLRLVTLISEASSYARDAVLCLDIHTVIVNLVLSATTPSIVQSGCEALFALFANCEEIDRKLVVGAAAAMFPLLRLESAEAVTSVLKCYVRMSNANPAVIKSLLELGIGKLVVQLLQNRALVRFALKLIGNLSLCEPPEIRKLIDAGLIPKLFELIDSEYASGVFWVLSNLLDSSPHLIHPLIPTGFVNKAIEMTSSMSYDIQKESAVFLATLIQSSDHATLASVMLPQVITVLLELLDCGVESVVLRCMETITRFCTYAAERAEISDLLVPLLDTDLASHINDLLGSEETTIAEQAELLMSEYQKLQGGAAQRDC